MFLNSRIVTMNPKGVAVVNTYAIYTYGSVET